MLRMEVLGWLWGRAESECSHSLTPRSPTPYLRLMGTATFPTALNRPGRVRPAQWHKIWFKQNLKKTLMLCVIVSLVMWETYCWGRLSLCTSQKQIWWTAQKMLNLVIMSALVCQGTRDVLILETSLLLDCIICNAAAPSHYSTALFLAWGNYTNILHCLRWVTQATANSLRGSFSHRRKINHVHHLDLLDHLS